MRESMHRIYQLSFYHDVCMISSMNSQEFTGKDDKKRKKLTENPQGGLLREGLIIPAQGSIIKMQ